MIVAPVLVAADAINEYVKPVVIAALTALATGVVGIVVKKLDQHFDDKEEEKKEEKKP
jgi:hypothetical protein